MRKKKKMRILLQDGMETFGGIGMNLTKEKAIKEHRAMWLWIAEQLENGNFLDVATLKEDYLEEMGVVIRNDCFCCEYAATRNDCFCKANVVCEYCPLIWGNEDKCGSYFCETQGGLWFEAQRASLCGEYEKAAKLARQIANLPAKE